MCLEKPSSRPARTPEDRRQQSSPSKEQTWLTGILEAVLVTEERPWDPESAPMSAMTTYRHDTSDADFLQLGHSKRDASLSPHPAHFDMV
jgi:hypothetical protein